jgi:glycosyltransferase involved in cell wall biosynthesis
MKILHVHLRDVPHVGGTVSMCRLHAGLRQAGIDSRILCKYTTQVSSAALPRAPRAERLLSRVTLRLGFNDLHAVSSYKVKNIEAYVNTDILNFHGIHGGFFSYLALPSLTAHKPAVFTIRDMWPFTGHCAVSYDCERWKVGCGACPYPQAPPALPTKRDITRWEWKLKDWVYSRSQLTVVTLSRRMTTQVKESMLQRFPVHHIPNGVDTEAYQPLDADLCRAVLGIPRKKKVLMFAAGNLSRYHKGGDLLIQALQSLPPSLKAEVMLLLLGDGGEAVAEAVGVQALPLGYVGSQRFKAIAYSAADLFVLPTRGEGLPNVLLESMACGTPMVSFDVGGVPDLVRPGLTGYLAQPESAQDLRDGIVQLLEDEVLRNRMRQQCRAMACAEYAVELEVQRYIALYRQLLQHDQSSA